MNFLRIAQISQVKSSDLIEHNAHFLFKRFRLSSILRQCGIGKEKGHPIVFLLYLMLVVMLKGSRSLFSGIASLHATRLKSPLNSMLNNEFYNWRTFCTAFLCALPSSVPHLKEKSLP